MGQQGEHQDLGRRYVGDLQVSRGSNESGGKPSVVGNPEDGGMEMECCWANSTPNASRLK